MYAAAGGASLAGRKARQHGRQPAPPSPEALQAPGGVRAYSCQHWESLLYATPPPPRPVSEPHSPCELVECAAGRAAWQEAAALSVGGGGAGAGGAARRCSVLGDHPGARRGGKWHRNNRVRDASYGSSSDSDGEADAINGEPWGVARLLYAGLGILAVGLVVYFVGTGDKGFKTPALRLVGPSLIFAGLALCLLRIAFCIFAKPCCHRRTNYKENRRQDKDDRHGKPSKQRQDDLDSFEPTWLEVARDSEERNKKGEAFAQQWDDRFNKNWNFWYAPRLSGCVEGEEMPLAGGTSRGPAQCSPARRLDASSCDVSSLSSGEEDERLRRYRTASHHTLQPPPQNIQVAPCQGTSNVRHTPSPQSPLQPGAVSLQSEQAAPVPKPMQREPSVPHSVLHGPSQRRPPPRNVSFASGPDGELVLSPAQLRS